MKDILPKTISGFLAIIFVCFFAAINLLWVRNNLKPPSYDPSWYLETSEIFYHNLTDNGIFDFFHSFTIAFRTKAPLISALPLPFYLIFGNTEKVAYLSVIFCVFVLNYFLFKLVSQIKDEKAALLAVVFFNTFPLTIGLSRLFFVEIFLTTAILAWLYYLLKSNLLSINKFSIILGIILGLGLLLKVLFPLYIIAPTLYIYYLKTKNSKQNLWKKAKPCLIILAIGFLIASVWYAKNLVYIIYFALSNSVGSIAKDYSMGSVFSVTTLKSYWITIINHGISFFYFALILIFILLYSLSKKGKKINKNYFIFLILYFFFPFLIFSFGVNKDIRFLFPVFPAISIMLALIFFKIFDNKKKQIIASFIIIIFPLSQMLILSFKRFPEFNISGKNFIILSSNLLYANRTSVEKWPIQEIVDFIYKDSIWEKDNVFIAIAPSTPEINHNNFRFYAALKNYRNLDFGGLPRDNENKYFSRINDAKYIIYYKLDNQEHNWLNKYNDILQNKLESKDLPYEKIKKFLLPNNKEAIILKKI